MSFILYSLALMLAAFIFYRVGKKIIFDKKSDVYLCKQCDDKDCICEKEEQKL
ncbi:MAG: hypothetical protein HQK79_06670 [Desulfobacterales bacterium]|nr:hypothetical protein [Desulfobacterales bacterium]